MRMPTKKWFKKTITNIVTIIITYILITLIYKRSLSNINWGEDILVMILTFLITSIVMIDKEDLK